MTEQIQRDTVREGEENENLIVEDEPLKRDPLTERHIMAYSVGHFNNDLCASMWFIYLSYYLINVVKLTPNIAATAILSG
jgi:Na+/melibiose symporter-like transporter